MKAAAAAFITAMMWAAHRHASGQQQSPTDYCDLLLDGFGSKGEEKAAQPKAAKRKAEVEGDENKNRAQQMFQILEFPNEVDQPTQCKFFYEISIPKFDIEICCRIFRFNKL